jgi:RNA polymerase sigma-70 factor (ECF subfamily)
MDAHIHPADPGASSARDDNNGFASTAWSLVVAAAQESNGEAALDRLCRRYWRPVYTYIRRSGASRADAEDATQDFFVYLLAREWIKQADPQRGSFRAFLLTLLRNFLANRRRSERAAKRGGSVQAVPLDIENCERELASLALNEIDAAQAYERSWAQCVLQAALERLAAEREQAGESARFAKLRPFIVQPPSPGDYERLSESLGLPRARVAVIIHRHSRRFAELVRSEVAETLVDRSGLDVELRGLLAAIGH